MRKTLLSGGLCFLVLWLGAQAIPRFQMPLYFEDAAGHRDTIVVGYDENASSDTLNPQFGEKAIDTPFDSIFEVRAVHGFDTQHRTCKKVILYFDTDASDTCGATADVSIFIQAKYLPITVTYDTTLVNSSYCHRNMILSPDLNIFLLQYWWDAREYYCMTHTDMVVDTFTHPGVTTGGWLTRSYEVEGQGMKELPGYFWIVKYIGICQYQVGTTPPVIAGSGIDLFPNPASEVVRVNWSKPFSGQLTVVSATTGQTWLNQAVQAAANTEIAVGRLPAGLYFLSAAGPNGRFDRRPFVVAH